MLRRRLLIAMLLRTGGGTLRGAPSVVSVEKGAYPAFGGLAAEQAQSTTAWRTYRNA